MTNRLYVGNLNYALTNEELKQLFEKVGTVADARVLLDRETGRSRGFGFVTMSSETEAAAAIQTLNGFLLSGRTLVVNEAVDRQSRDGGSPRTYTPRTNVIPVQMNTTPEQIPEENNKGKRKRRNRVEKDDDDFRSYR